MKLSFAGHETFTCRNYWLKKGLDHVWSGKQFNDEAVVHLGVGKNMVNSIRYWMRAFGLNNGHENLIDNPVFNNETGYDPYLEDIGTIWLLHYLLVSTNVATTYSIVFNEFRKVRVEWSIDHLVKYLINKCEINGISFSENSIRKDVSVLTRNYTVNPNAKSVEDEFNGLLFEVNLLDKIEKRDANQFFRIQSEKREELPAQILLASHLLRFGPGNFSFNDLLNGINSVGSVFCLNSEGLVDKIRELEFIYINKLRFSQTAGVQVLNIDKSLDFKTVLKDYYGN